MKVQGSAYASDGMAAPSGGYALSRDRPRYAFSYVIWANADALQARPPSNGGKLFHNHINFHHTYYSKDRLVSPTYLGEENNNTPFFFVPAILAGGLAYFLLPLNPFIVLVFACAASFYAHVFFDNQYHMENSRLQRYAWFRRKQELYFVHDRHANSNFDVIHFFWDRILGTYRVPDVDARPNRPTRGYLGNVG